LCPGIHWLGMRHTTVQTLTKKCVYTCHAMHACMRCNTTVVSPICSCARICYAMRCKI
jgi:hypothetical protein